MEENKKQTPEVKAIESETPATEASAKVKEKKVKACRPKKAKKAKLLKSQVAFKRGSYSLAITAVVLVGIIVLNILVSVLSDRFNLQFDMTTQKINTMSEENIKFLEELDKEIDITFCADKNTYATGHMAYYAQQYGVTEDAAEYYEQTLTLVEKYADYNKNINIKFVDTQSTEFSAITSKYSRDTIGYGDIVVSTKNGDIEKHKVIGFNDIYSVAEDDSYSSYGYTLTTINGNNVETALTSAIAYVTSSKLKKLAVLTGHSKKNYTQDYIEMLQENNYEVAVINHTLITEISDEFDVIVIANPTIDFLESEINAISEFLDNDGKLDKGLMFFADTDSPNLPNLYDFLSQWGIEVNEGILFETNTSNHLSDDPMTMGSYSTEEDDITADMNFCLTGYNVPLDLAFESQNGIVVKALAATPDSVVIAPLGTTADWAGADSYKKTTYPTIVQAVKESYNDKNELISSYVVAFSSVEFLNSPYNSQEAVSNRNITLQLAERLVKAEKSGIQFVSKTIEIESFTESVTEASSKAMQIIFMIALPIISIAAGIYIFIKRRNT